VPCSKRPYDEAKAQTLWKVVFVGFGIVSLFLGLALVIGLCYLMVKIGEMMPYM
jgi:flagellar biogenesis protein FliO